MTRKYFLLLLILALSIACKAQTYDGNLSSLITAARKHQQLVQPEKLYLQLDKNTYGLNDTLWFKAYLLNAFTLHASATSNVAYIEISDENNIVRLRREILLTNGLASGSIALNGLDFPEDGYTIRAYTRWMRNFDESLVFKKQFFVSDITKDKWLINFNSAVKDNTAQLHLQLTGTDKKPVVNQQVLLGVRQDEAILRRDKPQVTSLNGELDLAVTVRNKPEPVYATLHKGSYDDDAPVYKFPVIYNRPEKTDVQFMPESGYLVAGINSIVGFKAIGEDGNSTNISGNIINAGTNEVVASFTSAHKGMGSFAFMPQANLNYKAVVNLPDGSKKEYPLPEIKAAGTVLNVVNNGQSDSVTVKITATPGLNGKYIIVGQSKGLVCFAARVKLNNNTQTLKAPKSAFASGIVRFTLLNEQLTTLNERIIYIDHHDNLQISVTADQPYYTPQDSIALHLQVKDGEGNPVQGAFSMSVTNEPQLNNNTGNPNMVAGILLTADLKGNIEGPNYYFAGHEKALDDLLLTQGWTGFDWKDLVKPEKKLHFAAQQDISISGKVTNLFNDPVKNAKVQLRLKIPPDSMDTKTDSKGNFAFKGLLQIESPVVFIKARNAAGNSSTYGIDFYGYWPEWPSFSKNRLQLPWYVNVDTIKLKIADTIIRDAETLDKLMGVNGKLLNEVEIKEKKVIPGSHNLNGPGNADQVIDEHDIAKTGKITLLELLEKQVKGFRVTPRGYFINTEPLTGGNGTGQPAGGFVFNGVLASSGIPDVLNSYTSEDIKGIEVMSTGYTSAYEMGLLPAWQIAHLIFPVPFIEITTRDGQSPFKKKTSADVVYKTVLTIQPKQFYRPAYPVKNAAVAASDQRTTIHWEPNIITDKDGKATVTFYAAGQPATYTVTTEGSNMEGNVGSAVQKITVK